MEEGDEPMTERPNYAKNLEAWCRDVYGGDYADVPLVLRDALWALDLAAQDAAVLAKLREWAATMARGRYAGYGLPILPPRNLSRWLAEAERAAAQAVTPPEAPDA